ncbi:hypothetical protein M569_05515, partial [Genlisea aurea]
ISRLITYGGIKQSLGYSFIIIACRTREYHYNLREKLGKLTSSTLGTKSSGPLGLGYIRKNTASDGESVT